MNYPRWCLWATAILGGSCFAAPVACPMFHCSPEAMSEMHLEIAEGPHSISWQNKTAGSLVAQGCSGNGKLLACLFVRVRCCPRKVCVLRYPWFLWALQKICRWKRPPHPTPFEEMTLERRFHNKVAIVTGGAGGIGAAICRRLAAEGASVVMVDRDPSASKLAHELQSEISGSTIHFQECDIGSEQQVFATVEDTMRRFGQLDVVVNNAGLMIFKPLEEHTVEDWRKVLAVDLIGAFLFIQQAFLRMKNGGSIINVSSVHALRTTPLVSAYAAAKAALLSLTRSAAIEGRPRNIRVNAIVPGAIDTPMLWRNPNLKNGREVIRSEDVGKPDEVASLVAFLASSAAAFIQGADIRIDGGRLAHL